MRMRILSSSSKPISSPGRTDKFPPPLMRFLRSDVSSRSRGRSSSRASPLFFRRKRSVVNSTSNVVEGTQEPSSPKVTCIGQVRVRRLSKSQSKNAVRGTKRQRRRGLCGWLRRPRVFWKCTGMPKWKWRWRWVFLFNCRDGRVRTTAVPSSKNSGSNRFEEGKEQRLDEQERRETRGFDMQQFEEQDEMFESGRRSSASEIGTAATAATPPKNAFLLTRCRSSSLANRFWGEEDEEEIRRYSKDGGEEGRSDDVIQLGRFEEEDEEECQRGRRSCASEMGTSATAPPRNALLLTRSRSSSLACRFWVEQEEEGDVETELFKKRAGNITALESGTMSLNNNRDSTSKSRADAGSDFGQESKKSVGVCDEEVGGGEGHQGGEFTANYLHLTAVKSEEGKYEESNLLVGRKEVKLRRCNSEPARRNLEDVDPRSSEFWRLRRLSNAATSASHLPHDVVKCY